MAGETAKYVKYKTHHKPYWALFSCLQNVHKQAIWLIEEAETESSGKYRCFLDQLVSLIAKIAKRREMDSFPELHRKALRLHKSLKNFKPEDHAHLEDHLIPKTSAGVMAKPVEDFLNLLDLIAQEANEQEVPRNGGNRPEKKFKGSATITETARQNEEEPRVIEVRPKNGGEKIEILNAQLERAITTIFKNPHLRNLFETTGLSNRMLKPYKCRISQRFGRRSEGNHRLFEKGVILEVGQDPHDSRTKVWKFNPEFFAEWNHERDRD